VSLNISIGHFSFAKASKHETEYFKTVVNEVSGPVGDLCCGTGILTLEFSDSSRKIYAIDSSSSMLQVLRSKLTPEKKVEVVQNNMNSFTLPEPVERIISRDAFFHNLTPDDQRSTLKCVYSALAEDGVFAFNIHVPNPKFLASIGTESARKFVERGRYGIPNSEDLLVISQISEVDYYHQVITTTLKFETLDRFDHLKKTEFSSWKSRYTFPQEIFYLLELTGFKLRNTFGTYDRKPWNENTMLIIEARKDS